MYKNSIGHEQTVSYVAVNENDEVVGVTLGYVDCSAFYHDIIKRKWLAFGFRAMWGVIRRPSIIPRILRSLKHKGNVPPCDIKPLGSLPSTAVRPDAQGAGIAIAIIRSACDEFVRRGIHAVFLTTDRDDNDRVRGFYSALGWDLLGYYTTHEGRRMCWYLWQNPAVKKEIKEIVGE
jgi:GNAT superfamily N-acetyltransferase